MVGQRSAETTSEGDNGVAESTLLARLNAGTYSVADLVWLREIIENDKGRLGSETDLIRALTGAASHVSSDGDVPEEVTPIDLLEAFGTPAARNALIRLLRQSGGPDWVSPEIRRLAGVAAARMGAGEDAIGGLLGLVEEQSSGDGRWVQSATALSLVNLSEVDRTVAVLKRLGDRELSEETADGAMSAAHALEAIQRPDDALTIWSRIAKTPSLGAFALLQSASSLIRLGQPDEALEVLRGILLSEGPANSYYKTNALSALKEHGLLERVTDDLKRLLSDSRMETSFRLKVATAINDGDEVRRIADSAFPPGIRIEASVTLAKMGDQHAGTLLLEISRDQGLPADARYSAALALETVGRRDSAASTLVALCRDRSVSVDLQILAARTVRNLGDAEASAAVLHALRLEAMRLAKSPDWDNQGRALLLLREIGDKSAAAEIVHTLFRERKATEVHHAAVRDSMDILGEQAPSMLLELAGDAAAPWDLRETAVRALFERNYRHDIVPHLLSLISSAPGGMRDEAIGMLTKMGATNALLSVAGSNALWIGDRASAIDALANLGEDEVLVSLMRDQESDPLARLHVARRLATTVRRSLAVESALEIARTPECDAFIRWNALGLLEDWLEPSAVGLVALELTNDPTLPDDVRIRAAGVSGHADQREAAVKLIEDYLADAPLLSPDRQLAAQVLSDLGRTEEAKEVFRVSAQALIAHAGGPSTAPAERLATILQIHDLEFVASQVVSLLAQLAVSTDLSEDDRFEAAQLLVRLGANEQAAIACFELARARGTGLFDGPTRTLQTLARFDLIARLLLDPDVPYEPNQRVAAETYAGSAPAEDLVELSTNPVLRAAARIELAQALVTRGRRPEALAASRMLAAEAELDPRARIELAEIFGDLGDKHVAEKLLWTVLSTSSFDTYLALDRLEKHLGRRPALLAVAGNQSSPLEVRADAARQLAAFDPTKAVEVVIGLVSEPDGSARERARIARDLLPRLGQTSMAMRVLLNLVEKSTCSDGSCEEIAEMIGELGENARLQELAGNETIKEEVQCSAAIALMRRGEVGAAVPTLERLLTAQKPLVRLRAATELGKYEPSHASVAALVSVLGDPSLDEGHRERAAESLIVQQGALLLMTV